jgi:hypothetical protein
LLVIDTNPLNIVQHTEHLRLIEHRIREQLQLTPYQPTLLGK